jgi:peptidoglycan/LPS O-acetylase OafA/YrhL
MEAPIDDNIVAEDRLATRRRRDIQGLRAVAVVLVALDHAGVRFLAGGYVGVDVFFVLSGYLITGVLVSSAHGPHKRFFLNFYARRARRILPAAALTLIATDLAASYLLSLHQAHEVLVDSISATFFVANFHFASIGTNYFAMSQPPSPLQHYWSLSVEEQFYLVWPLLVALALIGVTFAGRARARASLPALRTAAIMITLASLIYAIYDTHHNSTAAYFSTLARAWELGLGAILALCVRPIARLRPATAAIVGWAGLAAIIVASTLYSSSTLFPGTAALLPTVGAAAVIAAGLCESRTRFDVARILSLRPFRYVGDRSYTFYLWHWPVLILVMEHEGHSLALATKLLLLGGAFVLSILTYASFENPLRRASRLRSPVALALWPVAILAVLFVASLHWSDYANAVNQAYDPTPVESLKETPEDQLAASTSSVHAGHPSSPSALVAAVSAIEMARPIPSPLTPAAIALPSSTYYAPEGCIGLPKAGHGSVCSIGNTTSHKSLVVFGDSHAQMWLPAILNFASREGYDVRPIMKYGCTVGTWGGPEHENECVAWYKWGLSQVRALHPSLIILAAHYSFPGLDADMEIKEPNIVRNITAFGRAVLPSTHQIVVLGDPPGEEQEPATCLLSAHPTMKTCSYTEVAAQATANTGVESAALAFGDFLDTTPWFCYHGRCPMVVGHTVVYLDRSHITTQYAEAVAPLFTAALKRVLAAPVAKAPKHS